MKATNTQREKSETGSLSIRPTSAVHDGLQSSQASNAQVEQEMEWVLYWTDPAWVPQAL